MRTSTRNKDTSGTHRRVPFSVMKQYWHIYMGAMAIKSVKHLLLKYRIHFRTFKIMNRQYIQRHLLKQKQITLY